MKKAFLIIAATVCLLCSCASPAADETDALAFYADEHAIEIPVVVAPSLSSVMFEASPAGINE